jgi:hypothetical protein
LAVSVPETPLLSANLRLGQIILAIEEEPIDFLKAIKNCA